MYFDELYTNIEELSMHIEESYVYKRVKLLY
jgi:hypothetical protein